MRQTYILSIIILISTICCGCSEDVKGELGKNYLSAKLVDKEHIDFHNIDSHSTIYTIEFTNLTNEEISQHEGVVKVFDIVGKEIANIDVKDTSGIKTKSSAIYKSTIKSDEDIIKIKVQGVEDIEIKWTPEKIVLDN